MDIVPRRTVMISASASWLQTTSPRSTSLCVSRRSPVRSTLLGQGGLLDGRSPQANRAIAEATTPSVLTQTARGWLASYDHRLSQKFWSRQTGPNQRAASERERLAPIASHTAKRENFKRDHYASEFDRAVEQFEPIIDQRRASGVSMMSKMSNKRSGPSLEELEKQVKNGSNVDEVVQLVQNANQQHLNFKPPGLEHESGEKKEMEEVHERSPKDRERDHVSILQNTQERKEQLGNARWRVEDKIKKEREQRKFSGSLTKKLQSLPMTQYAVQGEKGREEHALVDIKAIQNKCRLLSTSCSAKALLEQQRFREQQREQSAFTKKELKKRTSSCQANLQALAAMSWDERFEKAQRRKLEGHINSIFNKMSESRSDYPKDIPDSLRNHLDAMQQGDFTWHEEN